jgi:transcriptional regulator with XRE-family HTH domain
MADEIRACAFPQTNLKRIRESAGLTQSQLAEQAAVSLRSIQMYEQRNKDINKAQAITLAKIARVLNCAIEDTLENES